MIGMFFAPRMRVCAQLLLLLSVQVNPLSDDAPAGTRRVAGCHRAVFRCPER